MKNVSSFKRLIMLSFFSILVILALSSLTAFADMNESEPNGSSTSATLIPSSYYENGQSIIGSLSSKMDVDYYVFKVPFTGNYTIELTTKSSKSTWAYLNDSNNKQIDFTENGTYNRANLEFNSEMVYTLQANQNYYIKIANQYNADTYSFKITSAITESEPNGTQASAFEITGENLRFPVGGNVDTAGDTDYYKFVPYNKGGYAIEVKSKLDGLTGYLFNSSMEQLDSFVCTRTYDDPVDYKYYLQVIGELNQGQTYYIKLVGTKVTPYYFRVVTRNLSNMEVEPNNSTLYAYTLPSVWDTKPFTASIGEGLDRDYYKFTPTVSGSYTIETLGTTDVEGFLYDTSMNQLATDDDNGEDSNFKIVYNLTAQQTYILYIRYYNGNTGIGNYSLKITPPDGPFGSDNEGNTFDTAVVLPNGYAKYQTAQMDFQNDNDYFRFTATTRGIYTFKTTGFTDTYGQVFNSNRALVSYDDNSGDSNNFKIEVPLEANQTYYLKITSPSISTGSYGLEIANSKILDTPIYSQQPYDQLCWATSFAMVTSSVLGDTTNRTLDMARTFYENTYYPSEYNKNNDMRCFNSLVHPYCSTIGTDAIDPMQLTWSNLIGNIDNSIPFIARIIWNASGGPHFIVIKGYTVENGTKYIIYIDPWDGTENKMTFSSFVGNNSLFQLSAAYFIGPYEIEGIQGNNTFATANTIPLKFGESIIFGKFSNLQDVDYYTFTPMHQMNIVIKANADYSILGDREGSMAKGGDLYDSNYNPLTSNYSTTGFSINYTLQANTTYYLKVSGIEGEYNFSLIPQ